MTEEEALEMSAVIRREHETAEFFKAALQQIAAWGGDESVDKNLWNGDLCADCARSALERYEHAFA